jgi:hypothetical protein
MDKLLFTTGIVDDSGPLLYDDSYLNSLTLFIKDGGILPNYQYINTSNFPLRLGDDFLKWIIEKQKIMDFLIQRFHQWPKMNF